MKKCSKCKEDKDDNEFYPDKRKKDGLRSWCKECGKKDNAKREPQYNELRRNYRKEHKEEASQHKKEYYKKNKENILTNNSRWRQTLNGRLLSYIRGAKARNIEWDLTKDEFTLFWGRNCHYCGDYINGVGIDRVDSKKSYVLDNVIPCCTGCNISKMDYGYDEYIERIKKIYNNLNLYDK